MDPGFRLPQSLRKMGSPDGRAFAYLIFHIAIEYLLFWITRSIDYHGMVRANYFVCVLEVVERQDFRALRARVGKGRFRNLPCDAIFVIFSGDKRERRIS
jgi:hypothetical protein